MTLKYELYSCHLQNLVPHKNWIIDLNKTLLTSAPICSNWNKNKTFSLLNYADGANDN